jgi:hypothetical protein
VLLRIGNLASVEFFKSKFNVVSNPTSLSPYNPLSTKMETHLTFASRIEAAVAAYISVAPVSNMMEWSDHFKAEMVSASLHSDILIPIRTRP